MARVATMLSAMLLLGAQAGAATAEQTKGIGAATADQTEGIGAAAREATGASPQTAGPIAPPHVGDTTAVQEIDGVRVRIDFGDGKYSGGTGPLMQWVRRSLGIVAAYYGQFPTQSLRIKVVPEEGGGVHGGRTWGYGGGFIRVQVGREVTEAQLLNDWVLVHEMIHLALPDVGEDQSWFSEGLAVYVEGVAREQAGNRTEQDVFAEQMRQMPRGLPDAGDRGLDHTHTWARTYWGGAMFCFLADVDIHEQTANRFGLQDAMRAVAKASGGLSADWPISRVFATADAATGTKVLEDLYARMKDRPVSPDLRELWAKLGVVSDGSTVTFRDDAPLAGVRKAIMRPRSDRVNRAAGNP